MRLSDGAVVPGNRSIDASERERRIRLYHAPYHAAVDELIDACEASGTPPALLAIHSFTESWRGLPRPWHVGILWDADDRLAAPLLEALYAENDLIVGDNEPYSGRLQGDTLWRHGTGRGLVHALVEIRQDLIREERGQHAWAERLARLMRTWPGGRTCRSGCGRPTPFTLKLVSDARRRRAPARGEPGARANDRHRRRHAHATRGRPSAGPRAPARAHRRAEHRSHEPRRLLPQLLGQLVSGGGERARLPLEQEAREIVCGEPYRDWQAKHQKEAGSDKLAAFEAARPKEH